jgi:hypothetical protein
MVTVFAAFALAESITIKSIGVGMAIAVLIDATIVGSCSCLPRCGSWAAGNWWAPDRSVGSRTGSGFDHVEDDVPSILRSGVATLLPVDPLDARSRDVSFDGVPMVGKERVLAELLQEAVAAEPVFHRVLSPRRSAAGSPSPRGRPGARRGCPAAVMSTSVNRFGGHDDPAHRRRRLVDGRFDALSEGLGVREDSGASQRKRTSPSRRSASGYRLTS